MEAVITFREALDVQEWYDTLLDDFPPGQSVPIKQGLLDRLAEFGEPDYATAVFFYMHLIAPNYSEVSELWGRRSCPDLPVGSFASGLRKFQSLWSRISLDEFCGKS